MELAVLAQEDGIRPFDPSPPEDLIRQDRER